MAPMSSTSSTRSNILDKYHGRRDICICVSLTVTNLFPIEASPIASSSKSKIPDLGEWLAYFLYRTGLPDQTVLHSLHLLRRIQHCFKFEPSMVDGLVHHKLVFSTLVLACQFWMDDCYSNKSFGIASKGLFSLKEVNMMEMEMLRCLEWQIGEEGLLEIIESYEIEFHEWRVQYRQEIRMLKEVKTTKQEQLVESPTQNSLNSLAVLCEF